MPARGLPCSGHERITHVTSYAGHPWLGSPLPAVGDASRYGRRDCAADAGGDAGDRDQAAVGVPEVITPPATDNLVPGPALLGTPAK